MEKNEQRPSGFIRSLVKILFAFIILPIIMTTTPAWPQENKHDLIITTLYDNSSSNKELKTGWGYSCLIQGTEKTILFDIGSDDAIIKMDKLRINPASIDTLANFKDH